MSKPYSLGERAATALAQLCCHKQRLPQGSPTSPIVSNMICAKLDGDLQRLAKLSGCRYTRYADDITFSTNKKDFPADVASLVEDGSKAVIGGALNHIIETNGFSVNIEKNRLQYRDMRQVVTGLIVNRRPNVGRQFGSQIRAMLHAWEKFGYDSAESEFLTKYDTKYRPLAHTPRIFERAIRGKLAFLMQVRGAQDNNYRQLRSRFGRLVGEVTMEARTSDSKEFDVFVCHASEDKPKVVEPLVKALCDSGIRVWIDDDAIEWGDGVTARINDGLARSRFVLLVLSTSFLSKRWPVKEMNAVLSKEIGTGEKILLPLVVGNAEERRQVFKVYPPLLVDKHYLEWSKADVGVIVTKLKSMITK